MGDFNVCLSEDILKETDRVLHYGRLFHKYHLTDEVIEAYLLYLRHLSIIITNPPLVRVVKADPKDNIILACALAAKADYLVSGDFHSLGLSTIAVSQRFFHQSFLGLFFKEINEMALVHSAERGLFPWPIH